MHRANYVFLGALVCLGAALVGCGRSEFSAGRSVQAAMLVGDSFVVKEQNGRPLLSIEKDALEKEFLLQASLIEQEIVPMSSGLKSRVVAFRKRSGKIYLLEATQGHTVTNDLPQALVLAAFPIVSESDTEITFDFNEGMSAIFTAADWTGQDFAGNKYEPALESIKTRLSYLESAKIDAQNRLAIRQIGQASLAGRSVDQNIPFEVKYYLSPYRPDAAFVPFASHDFRNHGFFEIAPQLQTDGSTLIRATKYSLAKPIVFAISANTPAEFKIAVQNGIRYWMKIFPENKIQFIDAPAGVSAPDVDYNVVQWLPYDTAGFSIADAQMDPRTGEILHSQSFITSTFALSGKTQARQLLKKIKTKFHAPATGRLTLAGFSAEPMCQLGIQRLESGLTTLVTSDLDDARILKVAQDYVTTVVAHEVGHQLGLRHNFAGSLAAKNYPAAERGEILAHYFAWGETPSELSVSSTVMDYLPFQESVLLGNQIAGGAKMEYDVKASEVLYQGKSYRTGEIPPFCTDSHLRSGNFVDCRAFDSGSSMIEFAAGATAQALRDFPHTLVEHFIAAKAPLRGEFPTPVEEVNFDPKSEASELLDPLMEMVNAFGSGGNFLAIYNSFPYVGPLNKEEVKEKELKYAAEEIRKLGGLEKVFSAVPTDFYEMTLAKVKSLLENEGYRKGVGLAGQDYEFSGAEIQAITNTTQALLKKLPEALSKVDIRMMGKVPEVWKNNSSPLADDLARVLAKKSEDYLLRREADSESLTVEIEFPAKRSLEAIPAAAAAAASSVNTNSVLALFAAPDKTASGPTPTPAAPEPPKTKKLTVHLPRFSLTTLTRKDAARLLHFAENEDSLGWGFAERTAVKTKLIKTLNEACGCDIEKISPDEVKVADDAKRKAVTRWFIENKRVVDASY